jgi:hypothetical protein
MMIKYAIVLAVALVLAAVFAWAFLPARHLPAPGRGQAPL